MDQSRGIRKFSQNMVFKQQLAKRKIPYTLDGWDRFVPTLLISEVNKFVSQKRVPLFGQSFKSTFTLNDVLALFAKFIPCVKDEPTGRVLKCVPVFYLSKFTQQHNGALSRTYKGTAREFVQEYEHQELLHKTLEDHHPDSSSYKNDKFHAAEVVFDVYSSLLRSHCVVSAYIKLIQLILKVKKFANLNPEGVAVALTHIIVRGVANSENFKISQRWRSSKSPETLRKYAQDYLNGIPPPSEVSAYRMETSLHAESVRAEMKRLRISKNKHDWSKFHNKSVYFYSWYWGIYQQMSEVERNRLLAEVSDEWLLKHGHPTMKAVSSMIASGASDGFDKVSPKIQEQIDYGTARFSTALEETLEKSTAKLSGSLGAVMEDAILRGTDKAREMMEEFFHQSERMSDHFVEHFAERASAVMSDIAGVGNEFNQILLSFHSVVKNVVEKFQEQFMRPLGLASCIKLDPIRIFLGMQYLIFLVNVDSIWLKSFFLFAFLNNFGILKLGWEAITSLYTYILPLVTTEEGESRGEETSSEGGILNYIFSNFKNLLTAIFCVFTTVLKGVALTPKELPQILKIVADNMKNFHFIGGGLLGIQRIIDCAKKTWSALSEWYMIHVLKSTPLKRELAKKVLRWCVLVRFFRTEAGMNAIRFDKKMFDRAEKLFSEGQALLASVSACGECPDKDMMLQLQRCSRDVQTIASYISRIKAASSFQPTMFHIQFVGAPGVGKSTLNKVLVNDLLNTIWDGDHTNGYWSYNPSLDYFDGYSGQKIMLVDDIFRYNDPKHLTMLLTMITNVPVILPMANLEDKGIQLTSEIMISSTNTAYPVGKDVFCMDAVHRRRHLLVEVNMDPNVEDPGTKAFSEAKFKEFYKGQDKNQFPHLSFNLLRPVMSEGLIDRFLTEGVDQRELLRDHAAAMIEANLQAVMTGGFGGGKLAPEYYFNSQNCPPEPVSLPCKNWGYERLLNNIIVRYRAFRGMESTYSSERKYTHAINSLKDLDIAMFSEDTIDSSKIESALFEAEQPFPIKMPDGSYVMSPAFEHGSENSATSSCDLDEMSFEVISPSTSSGEPTSDERSLTLEEERERTARIMSRLRRVPLDPVEANMLHEFSSADLGQRPGNVYIPVLSHFTAWYGTNVACAGTSRRARSLCFQEFINILDSQFAPSMSPMEAMHQGGAEEWQHRTFSNAQSFAKQFSLSAIAHYPSSFPPHLAKKPSGIPWYFLKHLKKIGDRWYFEIPPIMPTLGNRNVIEVVADEGGAPYRVCVDSAFFCSILEPFRLACMEFESLSPSQQEEMAELAKWREQYTGFSNGKDIQDALKAAWNSMASTVGKVQAIQSLSHWIAEHSNQLLTGCFMAINALMVFHIIRSVCGIIARPWKAEETSKYMHKPAQSGMVYKGKFTSLNSVDTYTSFVESFAKRNLRHISIQSDDKMFSAQAIATGQFLLVPKHLIRPVKDCEWFTLFYGLPSLADPLEVSVRRDQVQEFEHGDLALIWNDAFPCARDITSYLYTREQLNGVELIPETMIMSRLEGELSLERYIRAKRARKIRMESQDGIRSEIVDSILLDGNTMVGKSGSPVMSPLRALSGQYLLGLQAWQIYGKSHNQICVQVLTRETLADLQEKLCTRLSIVPIRRDLEYDIGDVSEEFKGLFTHDVTVCQLPPEMSVGIVGKTQFSKTPLAKLMDQENVGSERVPAALSRFDKRLHNGPKIHPMEHSLNKFTRGNLRSFNPQLIDKMEHDVTRFIQNSLDKQNFKILDIATAITGTREDGSNPMDLSTSPGIPFIFNKREKKGKRDLFEINEEGDVSYISEDFKFQYDMFSRAMHRGEIPLNRAYDFPKDELRPRNKALGTDYSPPKTRSVTCLNVNYILLWRQLTLDFWAAQHRAAGDTFPLCPGMNPEGPDWSNMFRALNLMDLFADFDVSNWDGFMPPELFLLAGRVICGVMGYAKGSPEYTAIMAILVEVLFGYVQFGPVIYQKYRGMISGFPGTAEMNSLVHFLLIYYIYLLLVPPQLSSFAAFLYHVQVFIYGDDILIGFSKFISQYFNGISIKEKYEYIGYPVTSADKDSAVKFGKPLSECQFLKSGWRKLQDGIYLRTLDLSVAYDLLYWVRAKQNPLEQFYSNLQDALFIVFAHGRDVYTSFVDKLNSWLVSLNMECLYISYDDQLVNYLSRYYADA
uniref:Genome polyprotein n=1 Tax=Xiangshan picorna-like virus 6 TaxID=2886222 RepID=A0A8K1P3H5_9VIRU|nr:MAG: hypothetical protein [Xiangshan picorna-like virus 6]